MKLVSSLLFAIAPVMASAATFPDTDGSWLKSAERLNLSAAKQVLPGMTKRQVRGLLGVPHFNEGIGSRTWNYWFAKPAGDKSAALTCQLQIRYDDHARVLDSAWSNEGCTGA